MANGSVTIDLTARITGYEKSLADFEKRLEHVDVGSKIGKQLSDQIQAAKKALAQLQTNAVTKATSNMQIEKTFNKVLTLEHMLGNLNVGFSRLDLSNINFGSFGTEITALENQLKQLDAAYQSTFQTKSTAALQNNQELVASFQELLGLDISKLNYTEITESLAEGMKKAAEEVKNAQSEIDKFSNQATTSAAKQKAIKDQLSQYGELSTTFNTYAEKIAETKEKIVTNLHDLSKDAIPKDQATNLVDQFFQGLNADNFKRKLDELKAALPKDMALGQRDFYELIFGVNVGQHGTYKDLMKTLLPDVTQFQAAYTALRTTITENSKNVDFGDFFEINSLISEGKINEAKEKTLELLHKAEKELTSDLKRQSTTQVTAETNLNTAIGKKAAAEAREAGLKGVDSQVQGTINQLTQDLSSAQAEIKSLRAELDALKAGKLDQLRGGSGGSGAGGGGGNLPSLTNEVKVYQTELERAQAAEQMLGRVQGVVQRWFSVYAAVRMVGNAIRSIKSTIKDLDKTMTEIAIVTDMSQADLWKQMPQYIELAQKYAASIKGVYEVSQLYYQQGLQQADVMVLTEQTLKMARISGLSYSEATDYMTNAVRSFKMEMTDAQRVVDVYSAIAASSATSTTELASAMSKTASSAQAVGSSFENTTAMMAVMIEATRESAENIGSAMKSIISRYGEMTSDPSATVDSEGEELSLNRVDKALQTVGITLHDSEGQFRNFDDVIMELAQSWDTIDKNTQRYIATIMAGNRQQSRFLALVDNAERYQELSEKAADSEGASDLQVLKTLDGIEAKTQQLQTSLQSLYTDSGIEEFYKTILDVGNNIIKTFTDVPELTQLPIAAIAKFAFMFTSLATTVTSVFTLIKQQIHTQMSKINQETQAQSQMTAAKQLQIERNAAAQSVEIERQKVLQKQQLNGAHVGRQLQGTNQRLAALQAEEAALTQTESQTKFHGLFTKNNQLTKKGAGTALALSMLGSAATMAAAGMASEGQNVGKAFLTGFGSILSGASSGAMMGGLPGAVIGGIAGAAVALPEVLDQLFETVEERAKRLKKNAEEATTQSKKDTAEYKELKGQVDELEKLSAAQYDSAEAMQAFIDASNQLATAHPDLISSYDAEGNALINLKAALEAVAAARGQAVKSAEQASIDEIEAAEAARDEAEAAIQGISYQVPHENRRVNPTGSLIIPEEGDTFGDYSDALHNAYRGQLIKNFQGNQDAATQFSRDLIEALQASDAQKYANLMKEAADNGLFNTNGKFDSGLQKWYDKYIVSQYNQGDLGQSSTNSLLAWVESFSDAQQFTLSFSNDQNSLLNQLIDAEQKTGVDLAEFINNNKIQEQLSEALADKNLDEGLRAYYQGWFDFIEKTNGSLQQYFSSKATVDKSSAQAIVTKATSFLQEDRFSDLSTEYFNDIIGFSNYVTKYMQDQYQSLRESDDYTKLSEKDAVKKYNDERAKQDYEDVRDSFQELYTHLGDTTELNEIIKKRNQYTKTEYEQVLKDLSQDYGLDVDDNSPWLQSLLSDYEAYEYTLDEFKKAIDKRSTTSEFNEKVNTSISRISSSEENFLEQLAGTELQSILKFQNDLNSLITKGALTDNNAFGIMRQYLNVWEQSTNIKDLDTKESVQSLLSGWTDFTFDGLVQLSTALEELNPSGDNSEINNILDIINSLKQWAPTNLAASLLSLESSLGQLSEDWDKKTSKATKGMNYKEAQSFIESMDLENGFDDLKLEDGLYYYRDYLNMYNQIVKDIQAKAESVREQATALKNKARTAQLVDLIYANDITKIADETWGTLADSLGLGKKELEDYVEQYKNSLKPGMQATGRGFYNWLIDYYQQLETFSNADILEYEQANWAKQALAGGNLKAALGIVTGKTGDDLTNLMQQSITNILNEIPDDYKDLFEDFFSNRIDWSSAISAAKSGPGTKTYQQFVDKMQKAGVDNIQDTLTKLAEGGETAVQAIIDSGEDYTTDDLKNAYLTHRDELTNAYEDLEKVTVGSLVSGDLAKTLQSLGKNVKLKQVVEDTDLYEVTGIVDLADAYISLGKDLVRSGENAKGIAAQLKGAAMKFAAEFSTSPLAQTGGLSTESLTSLFEGYKGDIDFLLQKMQDAGAIEFLQDGSIQFKDWEIFNDIAKARRLNTTSEAYQQAYKNYLEGLGKSQESLVSEVEKATGYLTKGTTSYSEMEQFAEKYKSVTGQEVSTLGAKGLFIWDEALQSYAISAQTLINYRDGLIKQLVSDSDISESEAKEIANRIIAKESKPDVSAFLSAENQNRWGQAGQKLRKELIDQYIANGLNDEAQASAKAFNKITDLKKGGNEGVKAAQEIAALTKDELTFSEVQEAYRNEVKRWIDAGAELDNLVAGQIVSKDAQELLSGAGFSLKMLGDGSAVIQTVGNISKAYENYLNKLKASGEATLAEINAAAAKMMESRDSVAVIDTLSNAAGMTYTAFGEILSQAGVELSDNLISHLQGVVESIGGGKIRITNFTAFAQFMQEMTNNASWTDKTSEVYLEALNSYNDAMISAAQKTATSISGELEQLADAGLDISDVGKQLNLTYFTSKLDSTLLDQFNALIEEYSGYLTNEGVLHLGPKANIAKIIGALQDVGKDILSEQDIATLQDAISSLFTSIASSIETALGGNLTQKGRLELQSLIDSFGIKNLNLVFTETSNGLRLSLDSAQALYGELSKIDKIKSKLVFDKMFNVLTERGAGLDNITSTMREIANLNTELGQARKANNQAVIAGLEQELSLLQQIANEQMRSAESFDYMGQSLPSYLQGPLNYWDSTSTMWEALGTAFNPESDTHGYFGIQDFYNMVTELNNMAALGQQIELGGYVLDGHLESAAALIEAGFNAIELVDGQGAMINLGEIGINLASAGGDFKGSVQKGLKNVAQGQIDMIDGLISFLESIVKMEEAFKSVDVDMSGTLDFDEMFYKSGQFFAQGVNGEELTIPLYTATTAAKQAATQLQDLAKSNKDLEKGLNQVKVDGKTINDLLTDLASGAEIMPEHAQLIQQLMNGLYQMAQSNDFSTASWTEVVQSIADVTAANFSDTPIEFDLGNGIKMAISGGVVITGDADGWEYNGQHYSSPKAVAKAIKLEQLTGIEAEIDDANETASVTIKSAINADETTTISINDQGQYVAGDITANSYQGLLNQLYNKYVAEMNENYPERKILTYKDWAAQVGLKINTSIQVEEATFNGSLQSEVDALIDAYLKNENIAERAQTLGIPLRADFQLENATVEEAASLESILGIERKTVDIDGTVNLTGEGVEVAEKAAKGEELTLPINVTLTDASSLSETIENEAPTTVEVTADTTQAETKAQQFIQMFSGQTVTTHGTMLIASASVSDAPLVAPPEVKGTITYEGTEQTVEDLGKVTEAATATKGAMSELNNENATGTTFDSLLTKIQALQAAAEGVNTALSNLTIPEIDTSNLDALAKALETIVSTSAAAVSNINSIVGSIGNVLSSTSSTTSSGENSGITVNGTLALTNLDAITNQVTESLSSIDVMLNPDDSALNAILEQARTATVTVNAVSGATPVAAAATSTGAAAPQTPSVSFGTVTVPPETWQITPTEHNINVTPKEHNINVGPKAHNIVVSPTSHYIHVSPYSHAINVTPKEANINMKVKVSAEGATVTSATGTNVQVSYATGNAAFAAGSQRTLMGELGPELVVSHGRYFLAGQNGAEFVDLDKDAIVFNHLQTQRLLENGHAGRGRPVTNPRNATSMATGNVSGPALASAQAALAALKQIRAMWQAMLSASLSDLGSQAGGGGGGGGGGGNKEKASTPYGYIAELERWYTLLRQINELEREINYEEALRSKIQSDRIINGEALYASQKRSLAALDQEIAKNKELATLQKSYYEARVADLEKTPFGKIFKFDPKTGIMTYNDEATLGSKGQRGGLFALAELNERDDTGKTKYTAEQQYKMLVEWGFADYMQYDSSGKKIESAAEKAEGKEEGPTDDDYQSEYAARVQAFWDQADAWKDELDELWDSYTEKLDEAVELEKQRNEILQAMIDNQIEVENLIESAIEAREQAEIDALQDERDALEESTNKFIEGLNDALDRERQMYQEQQDAEELNRMRRQVGILQRTGGSASQIRSLQEQIRAKEQEQYFQAQQDEIDAIQDAADAQIERLDHQIELMTETLEYQKEHGLLWAEVATIMAQTPAEIAQFITQYQPEYRSKSELQQEEYLRDIDSKIAQWVARRDDTEKPEEDPEKYALSQYRASVKAQYGMVYEKDPEAAKKAEEAFLAEYRKSGDTSRAATAGNEIFAAWVKEHNPHGVTDKPKPTTTTPTGPTETPETGPKQTTVDGWKLQVVTSGGRLNIRSGPGTSYSVIGQLTSGTEVKASKQENGWYYLPDYDGWISGQYARELERTKITTTLPTTGGGSGGKTTTTKGTSAPKGGAVDGIISKGGKGSQLKGYNHLSNLADNLSTNSIRGNYNIPTFDYSIPTVSMGAAAGTSTPVSNTNLGPISINIDAENIGTYEDAESLASVIEERFINIARKSGTYNYINR